jgi:hypothetical protein
MNKQKLENPPTKKIWTEPAVAVIDLRSAHHGGISFRNDGGFNHRS